MKSKCKFMIGLLAIGVLAIHAAECAAQELQTPAQAEAKNIAIDRDSRTFRISFIHENKRRRLRIYEKRLEHIAAPDLTATVAPERQPETPAAAPASRVLISKTPETTLLPPGRGHTIALQINTIPLHCEVIVDDKYVGQSPLRVHVDRFSNHVIQISRAGYVEKMKWLDHHAFGQDADYILAEKLERKK